MDALVNQEFEFRVLKINRRRSNVIVSRRVLLEEERDSKRQDLLCTLEEGQIVTGKAKNITEYGVFVDLGGLDGLLHITDMPDVIEMPYRPRVRYEASGLADLAGEAGEKAWTCRLAGKSCLAGDVAGEYSFDAPLLPGQRLVFEDMLPQASHRQFLKSAIAL